ncbi:eukaryotic aspartyl protease family protein [Striga asiatica]|uniref:Eukaryotic aspartyl protease family protein n=1 Tax=Striga asiatica TaxID=4170 RepID=A0A5A7QGM7_STRAF|nr:eukaryotic aspartyl protease family protein [Striga asiatica]GER45813.1 eukaryotic aspartyl protease family protein [Striga asiatica]
MSLLVRIIGNKQSRHIKLKNQDIDNKPIASPLVKAKHISDSLKTKSVLEASKSTCSLFLRETGDDHGRVYNGMYQRHMHVKVYLDASGTLFVVNKLIVWLAFIGRNYCPSFSVILANTQQNTYEVVFDAAGKRVGFRPNRCP